MTEQDVPSAQWDETRLAEERRINNPRDEPIGHFTGRCGNCGSKDLWDDATAYGCNNCGADFFVGDLAPHIIQNGTGRDLGPAWQ